MRVGLAFIAITAAVALNAVAAPTRAADIPLAPKDRTALSITVYNDGFGFVREHRSVDLPSGQHRVRFEGVSDRMLPSSAFVTSAGPDGGDRSGLGAVRAIDYQFDLLTPEALLQRSVGNEVGVIRTHPITGEESVERAQVLSAENGVVLRYRDRIETGVPGRLVFDTVPPDLHPRPTLTAAVEVQDPGPAQLALAYLTEGLGWDADYIVELDDDRGQLELVGRATLDNVSGADFMDASLSLMAGEVARAAPSPAPPMPMAKAVMAESRLATTDADDRVARQALADLHLYTVERPVTLFDRETKQIELLSAADVPFSREYVSESDRPVFYSSRGKPEPQQATIRLRFRNSEEAGPGVPLPAGLVRVYTRGADADLRFLGEERISHVAVGQDVELTPGRAFDVAVQRWQTDFRQAGLAEDVVESAHRILVTNAKNEAVSVKLAEIIPGDWTVIESSDPFSKESADRAMWTVEVPAGGEKEVTYRVRVQR